VSDWQERITRESPPAIRAEHDLRYRLAVPLIVDSATWCDLGCGNGIAAAVSLGGHRPPRIILADLDIDAVTSAATEFADGETVTLAIDLASENDLARLREHLTGDGETVITCFEVVEHLETFVPLVKMLSELAERGEATVLLSVPNDAFWSMENPFHRTMWGRGALEELRRLLPGEHSILHQRALHGSAVVAESAPLAERVELTLEVEPGGPPTHFIVVMGPGIGRVKPLVDVVATALDETRSWARQRDAHLAFAEAELERLGELREVVAVQSQRFAEWRAYINELERRLGLPLSGVSEVDSPPSTDTADSAA
jgi:2-polyprenyl-3-methyl-5-hydroxy-6-metoxy-1,4-benzoquinol methylase